MSKPLVAIVDYGMGNLYSVRHACERMGLRAVVTSTKSQVLAADLVILPGIGAFGDAMDTLERLDLVSPLRELAAAGRPLIGICLGLQLFMRESYEFGRHHGLGLIEGDVVRFENPLGPDGALKVPHVGWNRVLGSSAFGVDASADGWRDSPLAGLPEGAYMYFVHSFYARPAESQVVLSTSRYGQIEFCSSVRRGNIFACQFHPERSGPQGLLIYRNIAELARQAIGTETSGHA